MKYVSIYGTQLLIFKLHKFQLPIDIISCAWLVCVCLWNFKLIDSHLSFLINGISLIMYAAMIIN